MAEDDAADRASQEIKALLRRLDPKGTMAPSSGRRLFVGFLYDSTLKNYLIILLCFWFLFSRKKTHLTRIVSVV
jgi:hypothetical protein